MRRVGAYLLYDMKYSAVGRQLNGTMIPPAETDSANFTLQYGSMRRRLQRRRGQTAVSHYESVFQLKSAANNEPLNQVMW